MSQKCCYPFTGLILFMICTAACAAGMIPSSSLLPQPLKVRASEGRFRLQSDFTISVSGAGGDRLYRGVTRALRRLGNRTGLFFQQDYLTEQTRSDTARMLIRTERQGQLVLGEDESYQLAIDIDQIRLSAETDIGILRGLETFLQLVLADSAGYYFPQVEIEDAPRFPWRGLLMDVSRHFMPVEVILRNLDAMAAVKLNVLHWHLTDDQGFRIECKTFPRLHEKGSDGYYYTQEQVKEIIRYAEDRGIRVIPEFDVPAHTGSWFPGYPELASAPGPYTIERRWGIKDPVMDPTRESTYKFLDKFFKEMANLFPDPYMHIGGDENNGNQWKANPSIQEFMQKNKIPDKQALQTYFNRRVLKILMKYDKIMVGWDEIFHPDLPENVVVHSWRGQKTLLETARQGYPSILSYGYYVDLMQSASYHYLNDPAPADSLLTPEQQKNILGGEAASWAELVTSENIDSRIWPRTAAIAERFWSSSQVRDVEDIYRRLDVISLQLEDLGITHLKNYDAMLRRLCNGYDIHALKNLVDVLEQVKNYQRHFQGVTYKSYSPYTRVVDAAQPEPVVARKFNFCVEKFLTDRDENTKQEILNYLQLWVHNHQHLITVIERSPILNEIEPLSFNLARLAETGLEAMQILNSEKQASPDWCKKCGEIITDSRKPYGQTEIRIVDAVEALVKRVCEH
jgi:hexosaminidase